MNKQIAFLILLLYFVLEKCVFYVNMKKQTKKVTQTLLSLKLYWNLKIKCVYIHLFVSYDIFVLIFYLRNLLYSKE